MNANMSEFKKEDECECCDSGLPAIKVQGIFVCKKCNNFECGLCGKENEDPHCDIAWNEECGMCVCDCCDDDDDDEDDSEDEDEEDEEEYNGSKDFPPNETDETCPICLEAYDRELGRLKDGIRNSTYESNCPHWCCCMCLDEMYKQSDGDKCRCPICKRDITDWMKEQYDEDDDDDDMCAIDNGEETDECYCDQFNCEKCCPDIVYPQYKLEPIMCKLCLTNEYYDTIRPKDKLVMVCRECFDKHEESDDE